jgi:hypothetical protein
MILYVKRQLVLPSAAALSAGALHAHAAEAAHEPLHAVKLRLWERRCVHARQALRTAALRAQVRLLHAARRTARHHM